MGDVEVLFHRLAVREYRAAEAWYARRSPGAARRFEEAVGRAVDRIAASPGTWPRFGRNHRWVRAGRYPYVLYYRDLEPGRVLVVAIAHGRRRPGYWTRRTGP